MKINTRLTTLLLGVTLFLGACASNPTYSPLPPVKVITETVEVEIYAPPLPPAINLQDVEWKVPNIEERIERPSFQKQKPRVPYEPRPHYSSRERSYNSYDTPNYNRY